MQDEDKEEVDGHPRHVKEGKDGAAAQKVTQGLHVTRAALLPPCALRRGGGQKRTVKDALAQHIVKGDARAHEQTGADPLQQGHDHEADDRGQRDDSERR